jgi:hypothetical protein
MKQIKLTKGYTAIVDDEDFERVMLAGRWFALEARRKDSSIRTVYAVRNVRLRGRKEARETGLSRTTMQYLHQLILGADEPAIEIDHKDHNGLNNRRENLRTATVRQNQRNSRKLAEASSRFKGVSWATFRNGNGKWVARIAVNGLRKSLGYFFDEIDAAFAYDEAARKHFGDFAHCNFPAIPADLPAAA